MINTGVQNVFAALTEEAAQHKAQANPESLRTLQDENTKVLARLAEIKDQAQAGDSVAMAERGRLSTRRDQLQSLIQTEQMEAFKHQRKAEEIDALLGAAEAMRTAKATHKRATEAAKKARQAQSAAADHLARIEAMQTEAAGELKAAEIAERDAILSGMGLGKTTTGAPDPQAADKARAKLRALEHAHGEATQAIQRAQAESLAAEHTTDTAAREIATARMHQAALSHAQALAVYLPSLATMKAARRMVHGNEGENTDPNPAASRMVPDLIDQWSAEASGSTE